MDNYTTAPGGAVQFGQLPHLMAVRPCKRFWMCLGHALVGGVGFVGGKGLGGGLPLEGLSQMIRTAKWGESLSAWPPSPP